MFKAIFSTLLFGFSLMYAEFAGADTVDNYLIIDSIKTEPIVTEVVESIRLAHKINSESPPDVNRDQGRSQVHIKINPSLQTGSRLELNYDGGHPSYTLHLSPTVANNPSQDLGNWLLLKNLASFIPFNYAEKHSLPASVPAVFLELYLNASQGSIAAQVGIEKIKLELLNDYKNGNLADEISHQTKSIQSKILSLEKEAKLQQQLQEKEFRKYRASTDTLDRFESAEQKLNDLILANDRKGTRRLLEAYLPWQVMEPQEKILWQTWLEAIEHPKLESSIVMARGLDYSTDKVQRGARGQIGLFSTVLTKNQGNYTRRLRSLTTNRLKNGGKVDVEAILGLNGGADSSNKGTDALLISNQIKKHSLQPDASNFISFTPSIEVADGFATNALVAVRMDSRRLFFNYTSSFKHELEFLAPLIVFPDEVIAFEEKTGAPEQAKEALTRFTKRLSELPFLAIKSSGPKEHEIVSLIQGGDKEMRPASFADLNNQFIAKQLLRTPSMMCENVF